jgi:hypothetical protein
VNNDNHEPVATSPGRRTWSNADLRLPWAQRGKDEGSRHLSAIDVDGHPVERTENHSLSSEIRMQRACKALGRNRASGSQCRPG